ncbi:glycerophosphoryl diester phosphodiesterase membrane domain-containing protein [Ligilactobacillus apodemi]|nr:glycerophosphodiester phosphodiesterase [Ligilactobacillus apodemi]
MNSLRNLKHASLEFFSHAKEYLTLFLVIDLVIEFGLVPLFGQFASFLLTQSAIPYLSYTNFLTIITQHPITALLLFSELCLLIYCVFLQFYVFLFGIVRIKQGNFSLKGLAIDLRQAIRAPRITSFIFFSVYFLLIIPFSGIFFKSPLLSKVVIPKFILEFLLQKPLYLSLIATFYLLVFILSIRMLFVLPLMFFQKLSLRQALTTSFSMTKKRFFFFCRKILLLASVSTVIYLTFFGLLYGLQYLLDRSPAWLAFLGATLNLSLLQVGNLAISIWSTVIFGTTMILPKINVPTVAVVKQKSWRFTKPLIGFSLILFLLSNAFYFADTRYKLPLIISHRGVNNENGVQNTLPALKKTAALKPDFIEIDIQETKDQQFVVMHDTNLENLAGINVSPQELTLAELTKITVAENGHQAKIASFDAYLAKAKAYKQKLLIEIKTTPNDSPNMLTDFAKKYGKMIQARHHQVQSLDYNVVTQIKKYDTTIPVYYTLPYNFIFPHTPANGYSMEQSTLNDSFVTQAKLASKQVYSWTPNTEDEFTSAMFLNVDGVITDNVSGVKEFYRSLTQDASYAKRLLDYTALLPN